MKKILPWVKANLAVVICSALIVLMLPAAVVGSSIWNSNIKKKRQAEVQGVMGQLDAAKVTYSLPPVTPGGQPVSLSLDAPNARATEFFKAQKAKVEGQVSALLDAARAINQGSHAPLVEGVFPKPADADKLKTLELAEALVGKPGTPSAYDTLLKSVNAGGPADAATVAQILEDQVAQARDKAKAEANRSELTPEEQTALGQRLADLRLGQYRQHAQRLSVYATQSSLPATLPRSVPTEAPDLKSSFMWQMDYWMTADLLAAIASANTKNGTLTPVDRSVVKRIQAISIDPLGTPAKPSITGRKTGAGPEALYDVRHADLALIVASDRLPELINAFSRTNFMTVESMQITEYSRWPDLDTGYYYGSDHLVRVVLRVESVWLRSWTKPLMPEPIVALLTGAGAEAPVEAAPPPPPPPRPSGGAPSKAPPKAMQKGKRPGKGPE